MPTVVLVTKDMAESEHSLPLARNSFLSSKSIGSQRSRLAQLSRPKTFSGQNHESKTTSGSEEESASENELHGVSLDLDPDEGTSDPVISRPLERFRSSLN